MRLIRIRANTALYIKKIRHIFSLFTSILLAYLRIKINAFFETSSSDHGSSNSLNGHKMIEKSVKTKLLHANCEQNIIIIIGHVCNVI